jgi:2-(1,2-epoxy-1,2-dihydrophenyl)acetyl-CoA isomerase
VSEQPLLDEVASNVLVITLNRPDKLNAVTYPIIGRFLELLHQAAEDPDIRAVLVKGNGRAFSAGDDIKGMGDLPRDMSPGEHPVGAMQQLLIKRWYWLRKPTIVAVHGRCHGIAQDLTLSADFRIVGQSAVMGDMRAKRAVPVGSGGTYFLPKMIGLPAATALMLTGDTIGAADIDRLGLATKLVQDDKLHEEALQFAANLATGPTKAIGIMKYEMRRNLSATLDEALELELSLLNEPVEDTVEGRASFAEGRPPAYTGR